MSSAASLESSHVPTSSNVVHIHDSAVKVLVDTQSSVQPHEGSKALKVFDRSCKVLDMIKSDAATVQSAVSLLKPAYESDTMTLVRQGVNMLIDSLPGLLRALDTVAKLHPFIGVAVGVFNFVINLNLKRLDNDKKRAALFLQMKDIMEALLQLEIIHDQDSIGAGGVTIKAHMHNLIKLAADDITSCGNACDAYNKKHSISKVFQVHDWEKRFQFYIDHFAERRKAFLFALALHTGAAVDTMNRTVDELNSKMDAILVYFKEASDGDTKRNEFTVLVQEKGGPATVLGNTKLLRELLRSDQGGGIQQHIGDIENIDSQRLDDDSLSRVKNDLLEKPEVAMQKNLEVFGCKLRMQQKESEEEMRRMVHHEGDHVILAVTASPHDRIIDPWPGHVKTRHFILALRDYFREQIELKKDIAGDPSSSRVPDDDEWALRWVDINRLPAIAEAFDDDASGFITIAEVNQFTNSYVSAEEQQLREGLETVWYNIDAVDTVKLVMGPGRVEKSLFPVLYLLFKRDFEIFRLCHRVVLNRDELCDSTDTIEWVLDAVHQRCTHLSVLFKQRGSSDASQLRTYASELYNNWDDCENFVSLKNLRTLEFEEHECTKEDLDLECSCLWAANELLKYPLPADELVLYNIAVEDSHFEGESKANKAV
ncbi:hypothetical protein BN946_scf184871.g2 [Trametes cinnabarina]|uniref:EF-hand domain-containing protein n=1 Tax=Pycnoporus cinnabarinus TaxID=5643 RepID=A0A060SMV3_PYCCI|nr:hypothetical protein BN946_scf184871.g2 [Trametes cinnabarina]